MKQSDVWGAWGAVDRRSVLKLGASAGATLAMSGWSTAVAQPQELTYLTWAGHADPYVVGPFEQEHQVKIIPKEYVGGDQMLALLAQSPPGTFDVVLADAEYLHLLKEADVIEALDPADYPFEDYWPEFKKFPLHWFDDELYGVMIDFGYLGLSYNTSVYTREEVSSYAALWSEKAKGKVGFFDWYLPAMGCISLAAGNRPPFDLDAAAFAAVKDELFSLRPQTSGFYTMADIYSSLANGLAHLIPGIGEWVTLGLRMDGVPVDTAIPDEGGLQWTESLSIAKDTPKRDLARKFIQYTTSPEGQIRRATQPENKRLIPSIAGWRLLNETMRHEAEMLRMTFDQSNVMDEYKEGRIEYRRLPTQQSIEEWNAVWSEFKSL